MGFAHVVLPTPPLSVGAGLGNRATQWWHRTRFQSCGLGWVVLGVFRVIFLPVFGIHFSLFFLYNSLAFPPVAGGMATAFVDDLFLPLKARYSFQFF